MTREEVFDALYGDMTSLPPPAEFRQRAWGQIWCIVKTIEMIMNRPTGNDPNNFTAPDTWTTLIWPEWQYWGTAGNTPDQDPLIVYTVEWVPDSPELASPGEDHGVARFTFTVASREVNRMAEAWRRAEKLMSAVNEGFCDRLTERRINTGTGEGPAGLEGQLTLSVSIKT